MDAGSPHSFHRPPVPTCIPASPGRRAFLLPPHPVLPRGGAAAPQPPRHGVLLPRLWGLSMDVLGPWAPPEAPGPPTPVWPERGTAGVNASLLLGYDWPGPYGVGGGGAVLVPGFVHEESESW